MTIWHRYAPISTLGLIKRFYARKSVSTTDANMKQVHQQTLRYVFPYAIIKVDSDICVKVCSADPHIFPNGDALIAELRGGPVNNCTASMVVKVSDDQRNVEVVLKKLAEYTDFHCELAIPIKAALAINSRDAAEVKNTYGSELTVEATNCINIANVSSENIKLLSSQGNINCKGLLLGKSTNVETKNNGNIVLDKLQGDEIKVKTVQGNITTNSCYVESSSFETHTGSMDLKNVHKTAVVSVHQKGDLKLTGVHGNLKVLMNEGTMHLQLSELQGENTIEARNLTSCTVHISEEIEKATFIDVRLVGKQDTCSISLDKTLEHLSLALAENKQIFKINEQKQSNKLKVISSSSLTLGRSSWTDMMRLKLSQQHEKTHKKT